MEQHWWWLDQIKSKIGLNSNTCGQEIHVNGTTQLWFGPITTSVVPIYMYFLATCITVQSYPGFDLVQSPQVLFHWWLDQIKTKIGLNSNTCGQEIHVNGTTLVVIGPNQDILVLIWSNHHKCCSIYMYFLATCITVQPYPSLDLIQSPQVLFHLHIFLGHLVVIGPNQD
jgi:hypothetical protein